MKNSCIRELFFTLVFGLVFLQFPIPASSSPSGFTENSVHYANNITNGVYYGWCAATAGSCSGATNANAIASSSICPKGWKLPTITEYGNLLTQAGIEDNSAGSTKIRGIPYDFPYAGIVSRSLLSDIGFTGAYWSSVSGTTSVYRLYITSDKVHTYDGIESMPRYYGLSVRCIAL